MARIVIGTTCISSMVLVVCFLWNEIENWSTEREIDDGKIANFFTSLEAIIIVATLYFVVEQLNETAKSRKGSIRPDLLPMQTKLQMREVNAAMMVWPRQIDEATQFAIGIFFTDRLEIRNLGAGIAKKVKVSWQYDTETVTRKLKEYNEVGTRSIWNSRVDENSETEFILTNSNYLGYVPTYYLLMWSDSQAWTRVIFQEEEEKVPLYLRIQCTDVEGNEYINRFAVDVSLTQVDENNILLLDFRHLA